MSNVLLARNEFRSSASEGIYRRRLAVIKIDFSSSNHKSYLIEYCFCVRAAIGGKETEFNQAVYLPLASRRRK